MAYQLGDKVRNVHGEVFTVSPGSFWLGRTGGQVMTVVERDGRVIPEALLPGDVIEDGEGRATVLNHGRRGRLWYTRDHWPQVVAWSHAEDCSFSFVRPAHRPGTLGAITEDGPLPLKSGDCGHIAWWTPPDRATSIADAALRGLALEIDLREEFGAARAWMQREVDHVEGREIGPSGGTTFDMPQLRARWNADKAAELRESLESEARRTLREWPTRAGVPLRLVVLGNNNGLFTAAWEEP